MTHFNGQLDAWLLDGHDRNVADVVDHGDDCHDCGSEIDWTDEDATEIANGEEYERSAEVYRLCGPCNRGDK